MAQSAPEHSATFGAGCFWCVEAVFNRIDGVTSVTVGYAGGITTDPTYKEVCSGTTGHAEVSRIEFDPSKVSYNKLLEVFWKSHDPTTMNKQGNDVGTQYRSVIFYHNEEQKKLATTSVKKAQKVFDEPIITQIVPLDSYYQAEENHQDYYRNNPNQAYCTYVIRPKLQKLKLE
jgi:peptide-methionine (S)-S-oxide reductase